MTYYVFLSLFTNSIICGSIPYVQTRPFPHNSFKPSQAKVLAEGGNLGKAQVDVPQSVQTIRFLIASLGCITDTLSRTGECAYANDFKSGWRPWLSLQKTGDQVALNLVMGINLSWLAVRVLSSDWRCCKLEMCDYWQAQRWSLSDWGRGMPPCPDFALAFALQLRKNHGKASVRASERCSADQRLTRFL